MKKIITGVKPTGQSMHLGNLMGAVLPFARVAEGNTAAIFIADLHALTSVKDGQKMRDQSFELAVEYFSIYGIDTPVTIFRQSDIVNITKLMWILSNVTPYSLMLRAHSFKDFQQKKYAWEDECISMIGSGVKELKPEYSDFSILKAIINHLRNETLEDMISRYGIDTEKLNNILQHKKPSNLNMGVFNYPILMAADILGYDIDAVPVGRDQIQHLEMARDMARAFNTTYGVETFREPQAIITEGLATLPGIDGRKMSKSYDNFIGVFDDEKTLKKGIMSIVTDSRGVDEAKDPDTCNVFALIRVFATPDRVETIRQKYLSENAGYGYGHAKFELLDILTEYLRPYREARERILSTPEIVEARLAEGAQIMNARLDAKMKEVCEVVGVR